MRFPFLKLQLLKDNPCHIPDVHEWPHVVRQQAPLFPLDLIHSMTRYLSDQPPPIEPPASRDACGAARGMQPPLPCLRAPAVPPPLPSATILGLEDGSVIASEAALAVRVFLNHARSIVEQCAPGGSAALAHLSVEVFVADGGPSLPAPPHMAFMRHIEPDVTFYRFLLPLTPGNYTIIASIESPSCPNLATNAITPVSVTIVSNEQLRGMQPRRVQMTVVDQIEFNACTAPSQFSSCSGFTMHGDMGYSGVPEHALWSRHVPHDETVLFFYQHGINKAALFPDSALKVLLAMESRAAEPVMWEFIDRLRFDALSPPFDLVLTHDRALLQRSHPPPPFLVCTTTGFRFACCCDSRVCRHAACSVRAPRRAAAAAGRRRRLSQNKDAVHGRRRTQPHPATGHRRALLSRAFRSRPLRFCRTSTISQATPCATPSRPRCGHVAWMRTSSARGRRCRSAARCRQWQSSGGEGREWGGGWGIASSATVASAAVTFAHDADAAAGFTLSLKTSAAITTSARSS
jgi:hypothetical protein